MGKCLYCAYTRHKHFGRYNADNCNFPVLFNEGNLIPLRVNPTRWSNVLKQFVGKLQTNCLSVFNQFVGLALKWLCLQNQNYDINFYKYACKSIHKILNSKLVHIFLDKCQKDQKEKMTICDYKL